MALTLELGEERVHVVGCYDLVLILSREAAQMLFKLALHNRKLYNANKRVFKGARQSQNYRKRRFARRHRLSSWRLHRKTRLRCCACLSSRHLNRRIAKSAHHIIDAACFVFARKILEKNHQNARQLPETKLKTVL